MIQIKEIRKEKVKVKEIVDILVKRLNLRETQFVDLTNYKRIGLGLFTGLFD